MQVEHAPILTAQRSTRRYRVWSTWVVCVLVLRKLDVLCLIAQGLCNRALAEHLVISENPVQHYVSNMFAKLHRNDRSEAIVRALHGGLRSRNGA